MAQWVDMKVRRAGVLLHMTSLPGPFQQGVLGIEALQWMDALKAGGYAVWQFLPLGPTHDHGSPYESLSSSAGNEKLIDVRGLVADGWLGEHDISALLAGETTQAALIKQAAAVFWQHVAEDESLANELQRFKDENAAWLDDYALFMTLKGCQDGQPWWLWSEVLRERDAAALTAMRDVQGKDVNSVIFAQFVFAKQWQVIQNYAKDVGILLFGDLPIYVAHDSVDVWAHRQFFTVNDVGMCDEVAGVPPDYFSETGQRWGNPLYKWDVLEQDDFSWWVQRVQTQMQRMDMLRIDHFRGLEAFWAIPAHRDDGMVGEWRKAAGDALLQCLKDVFGNDKSGTLPIIAEDLGLITDEVHVLRQKFDLPGMKILHFAFAGDATNPYLPHNHANDMVVYTGTHDNDTTMGWWNALDAHGQQHVRDYLGISGENMPWSLIRATLASTAALAIIPMQDLLELSGDYRFNMPGTLHGNWSWQMTDLPALDAHCWQLSAQWNTLYGRS